MKDLNTDFVRRKKSILSCHKSTNDALNKALKHTMKRPDESRGSVEGDAQADEAQIESPEKTMSPVKEESKSVTRNQD